MSLHLKISGSCVYLSVHSEPGKGSKGFQGHVCKFCVLWTEALICLPAKFYVTGWGSLLQPAIACVGCFLSLSLPLLLDA